jgi:hypothetical protein
LASTAQRCLAFVRNASAAGPALLAWLNIIIAMSARLQQHRIDRSCYSIKMDEMDISEEEFRKTCNCLSYFEYKYFVEACIRVRGINDVQTIVHAMLERDEPTELIREILEQSEYTILNILAFACTI